VSGKIMKLSVKEGQMVSAGQFLLQIDQSQPQAAVERSEAQVASAKAQLAQQIANLDQAQRAYDRSATMKKQNPTLIADEQVEQLKTSLDVNKAQVEAGKHAVDQATASLNDAKSSLAKTTIYAPMSGRVTRLVIEQGETAVPGTFNKDAATLLTISDMSKLETRVKVDETDVARIKIGDSAQVQIDAFPDTTFVGRVSKISNSSVKAATTSADQAGRLRSHDSAAQRTGRHPSGFLGDRKSHHGQADQRAVGADHRADRARESGAPKRRHSRGARKVEAGQGNRQKGRRRGVCGWHGQQSDLPARKSRDRR
jgi:HlyD family secretion protein